MIKLLLILITLCVTQAYAELRISEFLASSSGASLVDEDGEPSDWIEIHNTGGSAESLNGYHLTDDAADLTQWTFPNVSIPAGGYLIVFASSKDRKPLSGELHTNFRLSRSGEYLALVDPQGGVVYEYSPEYPEQEEDISYGIAPDGVTLGYFIAPTPGSANTVSAGGRVADTQFSVTRGIFTTPFTVAITTDTIGAQIRYTTDGSTPTATTGTVYTVPISISQTTVLRAAAFQVGLFPTNVDTQSYVFPADVSTQFANGNAPSGWPNSSVNGQVYDYGMDPDITNRFNNGEMEAALTAIPSVMLTTDIGNLTDSNTGIYTNAENSGRAWERIANIEFIGGNLSEAVSSPCGIRMRGGASRRGSNPKHSFRVFFRGEYGNGRLDFPLFEAEGVDSFDKIDFRTAQNYSWSGEGDINQNTFLRDVLARDMQGALDQPYTRSRYYHLYLNGVYWGLFMSQERAESEWGASYLGGEPEDYDVLKAIGRFDPNAYDTEATDGDREGAWRDLWDLAKAQLANPTTTRYYQMQGLDANGQRDESLPVLLDVDNLIDYMILIGFTGAYDNSLSVFIGGASNNWYSVRNSQGVLGFANLMHDAEHSLGAGPSRWANNNNRISTTNGAVHRSDFEKSNPQFLHMDLADSTPEYRARFIDRAHEVLSDGGPLSKARVMEIFEKRRSTVEDVIIAESARWGDAQRNDPADKENWETAVAGLVSILDTRHDVFIGHLQGAGLYPMTDAPYFNPATELVSAGTEIQILTDAPSGTVYYTTDGSDPRLPNGNPDPNASSFNVSLGAMTNLVARNSLWTFDDSGADLGASNIVSGASGYNSNNWKHPDFIPIGWSSGAGVLGFGGLGAVGATVTPATSMGQGTAPGGSNPNTCYLRHDFTAANLEGVSAVNASILLDDGAIVYLNGVEIYRSNMDSGTITFSDNAVNAAGGANETIYTSFSIAPSLLIEGVNTLAVEVHQVNANSSDMGFDMDLSITGVSGATYIVNEPTYINARVLNGNEWSALSTHYYSTGNYPQPGDLALSEIHYNPSNPSTAAELAVSDDDGDFEFIELANVSNKDLELRGVYLTEQVIGDELEGVNHTFDDGFILAPGQRVTVVANLAAFQARYPNVASTDYDGEFEGGLGNSGEWLQLRNAQDDILVSFEYDDQDPWPTEADGDGPSLQLADLSGFIDHADPLSWIAIVEGGSPSDSTTGVFTGTEDGDTNNNGIFDLIEYYSGLGAQSPEIALESETGEEGVYFSFTRNPEAIGVNGVIEQSSSLNGGSWDEPSAGVTLISRDTLPNNLLRETYQLSDTVPEDDRLFIRLNVSLAE